MPDSVPIVFALRSSCPRCAEYGLHQLGHIGRVANDVRLIDRECSRCGGFWSERLPDGAGDEFVALQVQKEYAEKLARHLEELAREIRSRTPDDVAMRVDEASVNRLGGDVPIDHLVTSVKVEISWRR